MRVLPRLVTVAVGAEVVVGAEAGVEAGAVAVVVVVTRARLLDLR